MPRDQEKWTFQKTTYVAKTTLAYAKVTTNKYINKQFNTNT